MTDYDGNIYSTIKIGSQWWMAENLAYLPSVSPASTESNSNPLYYVYDYSGTNVSTAKASGNYSTYGVLYNWIAAQDVCPSGWHLPGDEEWKTLEQTLGLTIEESNELEYRGTTIAEKMKSTSFWSSDGNGTNESGFNALPGGVRHDEGSFIHKAITSRFWTSSSNSNTEAFGRTMRYNLQGISRYNTGLKEAGLSVRCVKD